MESICLLLLFFTVLEFFQFRKYPNSGLFDFSTKATLPIRAVLSIGIIAHHTEYWQFSTWGGVIVACFFFISGYGLLKSYKQKKEEYLKNFIKKRMAKICIPFIYAILFFHTLNLCVLHKEYETMIPSLLIGNTYIVLPSSWFVFAIIIVYLVFWCIAKIFTDEKVIILSFTISTFIFCIISKQILHFGNWWQISALATPLGMIVGSFEDIICRFICAYKKSIILISACIIPILYIFSLLCKYHLYITCLIFPLYILLLIYIKGTSANNKIINYIGKISFEIYLVQGIMIGLLKHIHNYCLFFGLSVFSSLIIASLLYYIKNKTINLIKKYDTEF